MAKYYNITAEEMQGFLAPMGFVQIKPKDLPNARELIFAKRVDQGKWQLSLRVCTGIVPVGMNVAESREVGEDSMHVVLCMRLGGPKNGRIIKLGGSKRVHRVIGWKVNLKKRIDGFLEFMPKENCPSCGLPLVVRDGRFGQFLACVGSNQQDPQSCNYTRNIKKG